MSPAPEEDGRRATTGRRVTAAAKQSPYLAGEIIGDKYRLVRMLGAGGMGTVWVAENIALDVAVAIKLIRADSDATAAERLLTEARAAAKLGHPAIVRIFDFGQTGRGDPFIVMELLHGESLGDVIRRDGRITATTAVQTLLPIADALDAAHAKGIVHRDLKPDNIFLAKGESGRTQPKVVDFGIAKVEQVDSKITEDGSLLGSPDYMSPEQARGELDLDLRTDLWSFCVVAYEAVTGHPPFAGANYNALLRAIVEDKPVPMTDLAACDPELWSIVERGLRKERGERWGSMRELGEALASWLYRRGVKEDVCAQSLRASWLDVSGVSRIPAAADSEAPPPLVVIESTASDGERASWSASQRFPGAGLRSRRPLLLGAGFVAAGLLGFLTIRATTGGAPVAPSAATSAPQPVAPPAVAAPAAVPPAAPEASVEPEPAASAPTSGKKAPVRWHPSYRPPAAGTGAAPAAPAQRPAKKPRLDEDLGF